MKKMIMAVVFFTCSFYTAVMAGSPGDDKKDNVTQAAKAVFKKQFPEAQFAVWTTVNRFNIYLVRFVYSNQPLIAYIDYEGTIVATARAVVKESLPITVNQVLKKEFSRFVVKEIMELVLNDELNYLFFLEDEKARVLIKVNTNGVASEIRREKIK